MGTYDLIDPIRPPIGSSQLSRHGKSNPENRRPWRTFIVRDSGGAVDTMLVKINTENGQMRIIETQKVASNTGDERDRVATLTIAPEEFEKIMAAFIEVRAEMVEEGRSRHERT